ncbi:3-dehydroquinate synthase [Thermodesulfobacteriota bacterium]
MTKKNIILTGFMATGKTTVGKLLAEQLGYEFVDTDELIEASSGKTIAEIFREKGEQAFRKMESDLARDLADKEGLVISTGGRLMLDSDNAEVLSRRGRVFCLVATPEEILERAEHDTGMRRPLLEVPNPIERIMELMQQREEGYGLFPQLVTSEKVPKVVTKNLFGIIQADPDLRLPIIAPVTRYEFIVGVGILPFVIQLAGIDGPVAIITDTNVEPLYAKSCGPVDIVVTVPPGGEHKTFESVQYIFNKLIESDFDRSGTIIVLGGSVISEMAGFIAATYMRGVDCIQCPTSLLAMVDTSIGGKVGVDLPQGKNLIGAFKQPKAVIADLGTLQSLPPREFASGMAEVIKHSLIADTDLLNKIENGSWRYGVGEFKPDLADLQTLVAQAIQVKTHIVQEDPFDHGHRRMLNLGHTFGHAIEQISGYTIRHGEAVSMGLVVAVTLSTRLGYCSPVLKDRIESVLTNAQLPIRIPGNISPNQLVRAMSMDKKKTAGQLQFVLLRDIGDIFITDNVPQSTVLEILGELASG